MHGYACAYSSHWATDVVDIDSVGDSGDTGSPIVKALLFFVCRVLEAGYTLATDRMYSALASVSSSFLTVLATSRPPRLRPGLGWCYSAICRATHPQ